MFSKTHKNIIHTYSDLNALHFLEDSKKKIKKNMSYRPIWSSVTVMSPAAVCGNKWRENRYNLWNKRHPLDVRIGMQIIFIEYCHQRCHLKLNADI